MGVNINYCGDHFSKYRFIFDIYKYVKSLSGTPQTYTAVYVSHMSIK